MPLHLAVLLSGTGTTLQSILDVQAAGRLDVRVVCVVCNRSASKGMERALRAGVPALYFPLRPYTNCGASRDQYDADLAAQIAVYRPDLVLLTGWMHILSEAFLDCFPGRIINLHPALPGECPGTDAIRRTFETRKRGQSIRAGCMVHFVTSEPDAGPVIGQREVPLEWEDSLGLFEERMHAAERELVYEVLAKFALDNGRVEP